ncbi:CDC27 protein [Coemansia sp. RSA 1722]|nr:CDC27 protein [Coemansia sp. RSA 486]KAJ2222880.1 CDC27 protein [Coemansia sp. RSA 485]KAJ2597326.1 CDC27 protein [Coemansia sp. RSA 1721]KAJ2597420.1 CDC27 protein [Coemansia sp. RSA 1722]KAJ2636111.1 CDC27 protein [Coemansia sp. RSA 1286]
MSAAASELLGFQVIQGQQVVTYRKLSNELQIHINEAKRLMAVFYDDHKDRCHATFALTGNRKREMSDESVASELLVALVNESELSALKNDLENAEYHVYSLEPRPTDDRNALVAANVSSGNMRDAADLSVVRSSVSALTKSSPANVYNSEAARPAAVAKEEIKPPLSKGNGKAKLVSSDVAMDESEFVDNTKAAPETTTAATKSAAKASDKDDNTKSGDTGGTTSSANKAKSMRSFFGRHVSKKPAASSVENPVNSDGKRSLVKQEPEQEPEPKPELKPEAEQDVVDIQKHVADNEDMEMQSAEETEPPTKRPRVEDMFDDDDDNDFVDYFKSSSKKTTENVESDFNSKRMDDSQSNIATSAADTQSDVEMAEPMASASENDQSSAEKGRRRVRKQRKVNRIKHTKNKRGMLVTQTVEEWESYSESESDREPVRPKLVREKKSVDSVEPSDQKKTSKGKSKSSAPQKSILSFFGKKK